MNQETPDIRKILFIVTKSNFGGAQRYVYELATHLPPDQFDVAVAFGGTGVPGSSPGSLRDRLEASRVRTHSVPALGRDVSLGSDIRSLIALVRLVAAERPDVVHLNSSKAGGLGACAVRLTRLVRRSHARIVFTSHGLPYDEDRTMVARALILAATWMTFVLCDDIICVADETFRRAQRLPLVASKMRLVRNGLSSFELTSRRDARTELEGAAGAKLPRDRIWIGAIAELTRNKGIEYLIEAALRLRTVEGKPLILIIGEGEERAQLSDYITRHGLSEMVRLLGFVPEARSYLSAFDIFAVPSLKEGLPYALLEAASATLPVVGSAIPGLNDVIVPNESGLLVRPRDSKALADALSKLIADKGLARRLAQGLHERVAERFSFEQMLEGTIAVYREN